MQSVTQEQCNRAEQKKQAHTTMDLAMAGALAQGSVNYGLRANLALICVCIFFWTENGCYVFLMVGEKNQKKNNVLWHMKIIWNVNISVHK